jgi:hypothetical protein
LSRVVFHFRCEFDFFQTNQTAIVAFWREQGNRFSSLAAAAAAAAAAMFRLMFLWTYLRTLMRPADSCLMRPTDLISLRLDGLT